MSGELIRQMRRWGAEGGPLRWSDERFSELARVVFGRQFERNAPYRRFCEGRGVTPATVGGYRDIPAVPTDVFKHVRLTVADEPVRTFRTSGTTVGERGEHHFGTLEAYRASLVGPFRRFCMPDVDAMRMLVIAPSGRDLPDSSLSFMLDELIDVFGAEGSAFFVRAESGQLEMDLPGLREALDAAEADGEPVMLLGTAFGFVELFESCETSWALPQGSRLMETGGFKGTSREISRDDLYAMFVERLGIPRTLCVSEYSMTELSSQAYTDEIWHSQGPQTPADSPSHGVWHRVGEEPQHDVWHRVGVLQTPPWVRVEIVDPLSFEPIEEPGIEGLIRWYDLANTESVVAVQTGDLGTLVEGGGFRLHGRAPQADLRGCSLTIEEIVEGS